MAKKRIGIIGVGEIFLQKDARRQIKISVLMLRFIQIIKKCVRQKTLM